ncbi:MAG: hypothetical protein A4E72_01714 [Syntrophus sp. PtaU1.Bin208]|nr:MAG: hypothetical protein A4E72_01714 [Syntrophus sp. PtaU1.Bin208]
MSITEGKYAASMDMWPLQGKQFTRIYPFYDHLKEGRLTTTKCKDCGTRSFPPRVVCPECLSENLEWVDLPTKGKVRIVTEEEVGVPPGFETPLVLAMVDLSGEMTLITRIKDCPMGALKVGDEVKLCVFPVDPLPFDGKKGEDNVIQRVFFCFEKA